MKKSEKLKGKSLVAGRRKQHIRYAIAGAVVLIVVASIGFTLFNPFVAKPGDTVMVYYTGMFENGTVFDSNLDRDPLIFTIGKEGVIEGFQEAVTGMSVNETRTVDIPAEKAYGPHLGSRVYVMNRSSLPANVTPETGQMYTFTRRADGGIARVLVVNVTNDTVTIDENHILTGHNLTFTIRFAGFYRA